MENIPIPEAGQANDSDILGRILENLPPETVVEIDLPSRNKFYSLEDPTKPVTMRPMNFEDEKVLASHIEMGGNTNPVGLLLGRCRSNLKASNLLLMDKIYLVMKLREISYGEEFQASITCKACHKDTDVTFDLTQLPVNYVSEDFTLPMSIMLPVLKKEVKVLMPTTEDEDLLVDTSRAMKKLWKFVAEVDGCSNKAIISEVINKLPLRDVHTIIDAIASQEYGVQTEVQFQCLHCKENTLMDLPITPDFFTVS